MSDLVPVRRALISVSDKTGLKEFANALAKEFNVELISTGGTAKFLREAGLPVKDVCQHRRKSGEIIDVEVWWSNITLADKQAWIASVVDITAARKAEETLRQTVERAVRNFEKLAVHRLHERERYRSRHFDQWIGGRVG